MPSCPPGRPRAPKQARSSPFHRLADSTIVTIDWPPERRPHHCGQQSHRSAGGFRSCGRRKRGHVGPTAAWQPVGVDPFYPAIESARLRPHEGTRSALSAPSLSFSEGQAQFYTAASVLNGRHACSFFAPPTTVGDWKKLFGKVIGSQSPGTGTVPKIETRRYEAINA